MSVPDAPMTPARAEAQAGEGGLIHVAETLVEQASVVIELIAALILMIGAARFLMVAGVTAVTRRDHLSRAFQAARLRLGAYILAGLEFLIVADILFTIVNRTLDDLIALAIIAGVRTLVSYFLGKELAELREAGQRGDEGAAQAADAMTPPARADQSR